MYTKTLRDVSGVMQFVFRVCIVRCERYAHTVCCVAVDQWVVIYIVREMYTKTLRVGVIQFVLRIYVCVLCVVRDSVCGVTVSEWVFRIMIFFVLFGSPPFVWLPPSRL